MCIRLISAARGLTLLLCMWRTSDGPRQPLTWDGWAPIAQWTSCHGTQGDGFMGGHSLTGDLDAVPTAQQDGGGTAGLGQRPPVPTASQEPHGKAEPYSGGTRHGKLKQHNMSQHFFNQEGLELVTSHSHPHNHHSHSVGTTLSTQCHGGEEGETEDLFTPAPHQRAHGGKRKGKRYRHHHQSSPLEHRMEEGWVTGWDTCGCQTSPELHQQWAAQGEAGVLMTAL